MPSVSSRAELITLALALGTHSIDGWSESEEEMVTALPSLPVATIAAAKLAIQQGQDPLGDIFCRLLSPEQRRPLAATYTPDAIIAGMLAWAAGQFDPTRVVDPGASSARFLVAAGRTFPQAELVMVVGRTARPSAHIGHTYGASPSRFRAQSRRRQVHKHRAWTLPARSP
jgi:adenine-specific DNA-methyltransferase